MTGRSCAISELTLPGVVVPMVSAIAKSVDTAIARCGGDVEDPLRRRRPFERAVPRGGDDDLDSDIAVMGDSDDLVDLLGGLRAAAPDVGLAECVAGRHHVFDRAQPRGDGPLSAVGAGDQRGELDVGVVAQVGGELGGVGHRRHLLSATRTRWPPPRAPRWRRRLPAVPAWPTTGLASRSATRRAATPREYRRAGSQHLLGAQLRELVGGLAEQPDVDVVVVLTGPRRAGVAHTARRFGQHRHDSGSQHRPRRVVRRNARPACRGPAAAGR